MAGFSANVATKLQGEDSGLALSTGVCAAAASMPSRSNLDLDECQFGDRPLLLRMLPSRSCFSFFPGSQSANLQGTWIA